MTHCREYFVSTGISVTYKINNTVWFSFKRKALVNMDTVIFGTAINSFKGLSLRDLQSSINNILTFFIGVFFFLHLCMLTALCSLDLLTSS